MKKVILIVVLLGLIFYTIQRGFLLKFESKCIVTNENGKVIPAKIYTRTVQTKMDGKEESVYEILVFFDNQEMKFCNPILFIPKYNMVGVVEGGEQEFISCGNIVAVYHKVCKLKSYSEKF